jgi:DNA-binding NarL/FixJ family response regulator
MTLFFQPMNARRSNGAAKPQARILIVDSRPLVREGLTAVLQRESDLYVCGAAQNRHGALEAIPLCQPDLTIVAVKMGDPDGLELIKDLRARFPKIKVLVVSMLEELLPAERALRAGALGYVAGEEPPQQLVEAVRQVLRGEIFVSHRVAVQMAARFVAHPCAKPQAILSTLSDREFQIFELLSEGSSRREIAERLCLGVNTVETYRARIREKLHLKNARELFQFAACSRREYERELLSSSATLCHAR